MKPILTTLSVAVLAAGLFSPSLALAATSNCAAGDASNITSAHRVTAKSLRAAKDADIVPIASCELPDVSSALGSKGSRSVRRSISGNTALIGEVQSQGYTAADILGATRTGSTITIYVK